MKKTSIVMLVLVAGVVLLAGCATMSVPGDWVWATGYHQMIEPVTTMSADSSDGTMAVTIVSAGENIAQASIENTSERPVTIIWDRSSYSIPGGYSSRIITGETTRIDVSRSQPPLTIGAGNSTREILIAAKAVEDDEISSWMAEDGEFLIAYEQGEASNFLSVPIDSVERTPGDELLGYVKVEQIRWHPLFIGFPGRIRSSLREEARTKAEAQYGDDVRLVNERFTSEWHPLSLLIGFSMYGWVENAALSVTVLNPALGQ